MAFELFDGELDAPEVGAAIDRSRPKLQNADGSFSTEETITIEADGRHYLIPTIVDGKRVGEAEAVRLWRAGKNSQVGDFGSATEASAVAVARSKRIGDENKDVTVFTGELDKIAVAPFTGKLDEEPGVLSRGYAAVAKGFSRGTATGEPPPDPNAMPLDTSATAVRKIDNAIDAERLGTIQPITGAAPTAGNIASDLAGALPQVGRSIRESIRTGFADVIGADAMRTDAMRKYGQNELDTAISTPKFDSNDTQSIYGGAKSTIQTAPAIATMFANPVVGLTAIGAQAGVPAYGKYRERGAAPDMAARGAVVEGIAEAGFEALPMGFLVSKFGKVGFGELMTGLLARELPTEIATTVVQQAVDTAIANPDKSWNDYYAQLPADIRDTVIATVTQVGLMGGAHGVARRMQPRADVPMGQPAAAPIEPPTGTPPSTDGGQVDAKPNALAGAITEAMARLAPRTAGQADTVDEAVNLPITPIEVGLHGELAAMRAKREQEAEIAKETESKGAELAPVDTTVTPADGSMLAPEVSAQLASAAENKPISDNETMREEIRAMRDKIDTRIVGVNADGAPVIETQPFMRTLDGKFSEPPVAVPPVEALQQEQVDATSGGIVDASVASAGGQSIEPVGSSGVTGILGPVASDATTPNLGVAGTEDAAAALPIVPRQNQQDAALSESSESDIGEFRRLEFLRELKKAGGVRINDVKDILGEDRKRSVNLAPTLFTKRGMGIDTLAQWMQERGYLQREGAIDGMTAGEQAHEILRAAVHRQGVFKLEDLDDIGQRRFSERMAQESDLTADEAEDVLASVPADVTLDEVVEFFAAEPFLTEHGITDLNQIEGIMERASLRVSGDLTYEQAIREEAQSAKAAVPGEGRRGDTGGEAKTQEAAAAAEVLESPTPASLKAKEARAADTSVADREAADRERDVFALTPPTGELEQGATQQGEILTVQGEPTEAAKLADEDAGTGAAAIIEHTTQKGKVLRGIVRHDLTILQAQAIDPYTFQKDGGWFIREKHIGTPTPTTEQAVVQKHEQAVAQRAIAAEVAAIKTKGQTSKLREVAQKQIDDAEESMGRDRLSNTAKRARQASSAEADAANSKRIAQTMLAIADSIDDGTAKALAQVNSRAVVEQLDTMARMAKYERDRREKKDTEKTPHRPFDDEDLRFVKWPTAELDAGDRGKLLDAIKGKKGSVELQSPIRYAREYTLELHEKLRKLLDDKQIAAAAGYYKPEAMQRQQRLARAGITHDNIVEAIRELKALPVGEVKVDRVKQLERALVGQKVGLDFFPTPKETAQRMVIEADIESGMKVLEPSAGNGNIAEAIRDAGVKPDVAELSSSLREVLQAKGFNVIGQDFMQITEGGYDRIVMNPPFSNSQDIEHVRHAYTLLKPGGRVVAIMGEGAFFRGDRKATGFREWLDEVNGTEEKLPPGTFKDVQLLASTGTNARLVVIDKPGQMLDAPASMKISVRPDDVLETRVDAPPFYSELARQTEAINAKAMTSGDWAVRLRALKVKPDELHWSGVLDWLAMQENKSAKISKADVTAFIDANGVKVEDVILGAPPVNRLTDLDDRLRAGDSLTTAEQAEYNRMVDDDAFPLTSERATKFSDRVLPGAVPGTYREFVLTLPNNDPEAFAELRESGRRLQLAEAAERVAGDDVINRGDLTDATDKAHAEMERIREKIKSKRFQSGHFDQPNVVAHMRANERIDADGKRVLFVEEFQSDWAQKGRREGFGDRKDRSNYYLRLPDGEIGRDFTSKEEGETFLRANPNAGTLDREYVPAGNVPSAPFVGKTDAWVALSLKRMIRYAAENGFDSVAWTTGEQQAARYDLSKQVKSIEWNRFSPGPTMVEITPLSGNAIEFRLDASGRAAGHGGAGTGTQFDGKHITDIVGKEIGERIVKERDGSLSGAGLRIGGEGMKAFYDTIVPKVANDILKKLGGGKVGAVSLPAFNEYRAIRMRDEAQGESDTPVATDTSERQPGFDITPQMREMAMAGQSLFTGQSVLPYFSAKYAGRATPEQALADAKVELARVGLSVPDVTMRMVPLPDRPTVPMSFDLNRRVIVYNTASAFHTHAIDVQGMVEELLHAADHLGENRLISASMKRLAVDGDLRSEVRRAWNSEFNPRVSDFFDYPLNAHRHPNLSPDRVTAELYARLGVFYISHPDLMAQMAPKTFEAYDGIFKGATQRDDGKVRAAIPGAARSGEAGAVGLGQAAIEPGAASSERNAGQDQERGTGLVPSGARQESADKRLERFRQRSAEALGGEVSGAAADLRRLETKASATGVDSPAFKRWFGDSKVVDKRGKPLVVYHGTRSENAISKFRVPAYFTEHAAWANQFGSNATYPVYLRIERPREINGDLEGRHFEWDKSDVADMKKAGHDGVIIKSRDASTVYTVFDSEQIKSVTGNRGTFDPDSPNILETRVTDDRVMLDAPVSMTITVKPTGLARIIDPVTHRLKVGEKAFGALEKYVGGMFAKIGLASNAPPEFRRMLSQYRGDKGRAADAAKDVIEAGKSLPAAERELISDYVEQEMTAGVVPPSHVVEVAGTMDAAIATQTQELIDLKMLSPEAAAKWKGRYLPRYYAKHMGNKSVLAKMFRIGIRGNHIKARGLAEIVDRKDLVGWQAEGFEVRPDIPTGDANKVVVWRDWTKGEREKMGEVRDAVYRFARGMLETGSDIASARLFERVAASEFATRNRYMAAQNDWQQVPDVEIEGTALKKYGALSGMYVDPAVWKELSFEFRDRGDFERSMASLTALWKEGKTVMNPATHAANVVSNVVMADFAGISPLNARAYVMAMNDFLFNGTAMRAAKDVGLLGGEAIHEIRQWLPDPGTLAAATTPGGIAAAFNSKAATMLGKYSGATFYRENMRKLYGAEDAFFKVLIFKHYTQRGMTPAKAADEANRYIFDYRDVPPMVQRIRDSALGIPFITYTYKAIPAVAHSILTRPWIVAKYAALFTGINALAFAIGGGGDEDEERKHMPDYMKGWTPLFYPSHIRMMNDDANNPQYLNIARMTPLGTVMQPMNGEGVPMLQSFAPNHPIYQMILTLGFNRDSLTGRDFFKPSDDLEDKVKKASKYVYQQLMPSTPVVPGSVGWDKVLNGVSQALDRPIDILGASYTGKVQGRSGREETLPKALANTLVGVNLRGFNVDEQVAFKRGALMREIDEIKANVKRIGMNEAIGDAAKERRIEHEFEKIEKVHERLQDL